jgi:phosphoglycolate phosphatase-like HAD superfamily hydrolase
VINNQGFAVVFDFDGTLIDSKEVKTLNYLKAFETIFKTKKEVREKIVKSCEKTSGANRFLQLSDTLKTVGLTANDKQKESWSKLYSLLNSKSLKKIPEFPSVRSIFEKLNKKGVKIFAASGILEEEFLNELSRRKLTNFFLKAKGGDKLGFLKSLKERGFWPILFVGDTVYDEKTAIEAGVLFFKIAKDSDFLDLIIFLNKNKK